MLGNNREILFERERQLIALLNLCLTTEQSLQDDTQYLLENLEEKSELLMMKWNQKFESMKKEILHHHDEKKKLLELEKDALHKKLAEYKRATQDFSNSTTGHLMEENFPHTLSTNTKFEKYIDLSETLTSIQHASLKTSEDIAHCNIEGPSDCFVNKEYKFTLRAVTKRGTNVPLTFNPFKLTLLSSPKQDSSPNLIFAIENHHVSMAFYTKVYGAYKYRIDTICGQTVNPSYTLYISPDTIERFLLPTPTWYGGSFNPMTNEFWIKSSYTSRHVICYDKKGIKARSFDLPCDAIFLHCDVNGEVFVGNGSKQYIRLDKDLKVLWSVTHSKKPAYPIVSDGVNVHAYCQNEFLVIDKWKGVVLEKIKLDTHIDEIFSFIIYNNEFYVSDLLEIKVFDKNGKLMRSYPSNKSCTLTVYDNAVFYCNFNECSWSRLILDQ